MFPLSTQAKEAIKIGLAIVIGYYVALRLDGMSSTWISISIAFISLPTAGQSMQKGLLRMGGTLLAFVVGLFYLGLFPQDRWLFLLSFTPYLLFVSYMIQGKNGQYFWFCAGFVTMMITTAGPGSSEHAFEFATYRALETMIGIAIWTTVSIVLWPRSNLGALKKASLDLLSAHEQLVRRYREQAFGGDSKEAGEPEPLKVIRDQAGKLIIQLQQAVNGAAAESYQVREVRRYWRRLHSQALAAIEILDRLESGFSDMQKAALKEILLNEEVLLKEIEARFQEARSLLSGHAPSRPDVDIVIGVDPKLMAKLDHFERAAVEVTRSELEQLDDLVAGMVDCVRNIEGYEPQQAETRATIDEVPAKRRLLIPPIDPDRIRGAVMVTVSMWVGFLVWIYFDPPGHISWYQFVPNMTLVVVQAPFVRLGFLKPFGYAYVVGLAAYVLIMPQLSVFWQLGLLIFAFAFAAAYFFKGIGRVAIYLAMFNMLGIQNVQTYDFASAANSFLFTMMALMVVVAMSYITRSPRPEKAFVSLVGRFFRSCEFLLSRMATERLEARSFVERRRRAFHFEEVRSLPAKLAAWGRQIDPKKFPNAGPEQIGAVVASFQVLAYRMEDLIEARQAPQSKALVRELTEDIRAWRMVIEEICERWSERPEADSAGDLRKRLDARLASLNARVEEVLDAANPEAVSEAERANFYRLLGGFRGFSEAALVFAGTAENVDWNRLREERF